MSFQGDVGGVGLADLLQSLARGRDGVLTLGARGGLRSTLGVQGGLIQLLPEQDEDPEIWRNRVRQSWVKDPDFRIDALRMTDIARAQRIETLYCMLDSEQVHFRFNPGPVPQKPPEQAAISASEPGTERAGARRDTVFCSPIAVEGLLLEYARLKDEIDGANLQFVLPDYALLRVEAAPPPGAEFKRMFEELDGRSTLLEVADRLSWPLRQLRNIASVALVQGSLVPPSTDELLELTVAELTDGNSARAGTRMRAWIELSDPGPLSEADANQFITEWQSGRLHTVLRELPLRHARTLLHRLENAQGSPLAAIGYWTEFLKLHQDDRLAALSLLIAQIRAAVDPNQPALKDIVAVARSFQHEGHALRAAALWRVAAGRNPDGIEQRLEIGMGLLNAGLGSEGIPWVVDAAGTLLEQGKADLAVDPLRRALDADPMHREARRLLSRARTQVIQRTITRKNSLVTIAVVVALSISAVVTFQSQREKERRFGEITAHMSEPHQALKLLETQFRDDDSSRVRDLRATLVERAKAEDNAARTAWTDRYREAQLECTIGDPKLGLARALDLPAPPELSTGQDPLPLVSDLYNGLSARLDNSLKELGTDVRDEPEQVHGEQRLVSLVAELRGVLEAKNSAGNEAREFGARLTTTEKHVHDREETRATARAERSRRDNLQKQDVLLATARAHGQAGDYPRAMEAYAKLIESDSTGKLKQLLKKEMDVISEKGGAVTEARRLAMLGRHDEAVRLLTNSVDSPRNYILPWKLESFPSGARARFKDGSVKTTPFTFESAIGDEFDVTLELDGCEKSSLHVDGPRDRFAWLSRKPERSWHGEGRIDALPAATGDDHIVCDRAGNVTLLSKDGARSWTRKLESLSGVARSPQFLPKRTGHLLLVSEDGVAWVLDVQSGVVEGPHELPAPPIEGPVGGDASLIARLRDGSLAVWSEGVEPAIVNARDLGPDNEAVQKTLAENAAFGGKLGLAVLRRRTDPGTSLDSPWSDWSVAIDGPNYVVKHTKDDRAMFSVAKDGEWSYLAWEMPHPACPFGRLWIADEAGLRTFLPPSDPPEPKH